MSAHFYLPFERQERASGNDLTAYEKYQLSFHPERPRYRDYLHLFHDVEEVLSSDAHGACLLQTHRAVFRNDELSTPVLLIGQQTAPSSDFNELHAMMANMEAIRRWNHGMPTAASYQRAINAIHLANQERRMIIIFVDTPGADPTEESEANGIAWRIGETIHQLVEARVPTLAIILNRACSGGAIALTGCDAVLAMEHSTYLVITPEACSSILYNTRARANEAAAASWVTAREGLQLGIVDELVPEPAGPAHRFPRPAMTALGHALQRWVPRLAQVPEDEIFSRRTSRWSAAGRWSTWSEAEVREVQRRVSRFPEISEHGYVKRHKRCYSPDGVHHYSPVSWRDLRRNNFVCETCGQRYLRPSAWDQIALLCDADSFHEHEETRHIVDADVLEFPGYADKLRQTRETTGLVTAMLTGDCAILGHRVTLCLSDFGFFGGSFCMSTGEKLWRAATHAIDEQLPLVIVTCGGGARMHEGCSSMVSIPKAHLALTRVKRAGLPLVTLITDPTLGGVAIGYGSRGVRLFEENAGNIGFSGKRVIEQYTGRATSRDFQTTSWLKHHGHVEHTVNCDTVRREIVRHIGGSHMSSGVTGAS